jgi:pyrroline-5-carboxylate reductase
MIDIIIIGTGNVSYHFSEVILKKKDLQLIEVCGRKNSIPECFDKSISYSNDISKIQSADIYLICVSDDAIDSVNSQLNINEESIVIHSSGSTEMNCLSKHKKYGVLYPLQTFSLNRQVDFNNIPIIVEASANDELIKIKEL